MRILVVYGSTHGHTARVASAVARTLQSEGVAVDVREAGKNAPAPDEYTAVIVAASVHGGRYQKQVQRWVRVHAPTLHQKPTAFVSVCLAILQRSPEVRDALEDIVGRFLETTAWRPTVVKQVAGAVAYTRYNWFLRRVMKRIVAQAGGDTDTTRDHEYTDWNDLAAFARQFRHSVLLRVPEAAPRHAIAS
jgi:menaquinone-dependent protoporphyrinogen oxidase